MSVIDENSSLHWNFFLLRKEVGKAFSLFLSQNLPSDLSEAEYKMIGFVCENEGLTSTEIAANTRLRKSTVSETLNCLMEKGYVTLKQSDSDKRKSHVFPKEKAKEKYKEVKIKFAEFDAIFENGLSEEEKKTTIAVFKKIEKNLEGGNK